ncbi:MAG: carbon storage regulator [Fuerstiella sp.]
MLVLTRKAAETIQIGDNIVVKVIRTGKGTVKIGVEAPNDVRVIRGELTLEEVPALAATAEGKPQLADQLRGVLSDQFPHVA